jgi:hypothetical protein
MKNETKLGTLALCAALVGCGPSIEGDWISADRIGNEKNAMTLFGDGTGEAKLWYIVEYGGEYYLASDTFDIEWTERNEKFELKMECAKSDIAGSNCGEFDFTMKCKLKGDDQKLDCEGDRAWRSYAFKWERD